MLRDGGLDAVVGMYPVVHRLRTTVVNPWAAAATGDVAVRPPQRVLVYGVAGSGSTFIAERLADELATVAQVNAVVVSTIDEMAARDAAEIAALFGAPATRDVVLVGVSHQPWILPADLFASGGFERMAFVAPPDWDARRFRLWETAGGRNLATADLDRLVAATEGWAGTDLASLGAAAAGSTIDELLERVRRTDTASAAWLGEARSMIRALDSYGRVDDLVGYLQRYRLL